MARKKIPIQIETDVLLHSSRRCCICYGLNRDYKVKKGQIAHLNKDRNDNSYKNLAWLCLDHHNEYDSKSSQSKNLTINEVRKYREYLYAAVKGIKSQKSIKTKYSSGKSNNASPILVDLEFIPYYSIQSIKLGEKTSINFKFKNNTKHIIHCKSYRFEGYYEGKEVARYNRHSFDLTLKPGEGTIFPFALVNPISAYFKNQAFHGKLESKILLEYSFDGTTQIKAIVGIAGLNMTN